MSFMTPNVRNRDHGVVKPNSPSLPPSLPHGCLQSDVLQHTGVFYTAPSSQLPKKRKTNYIQVRVIVFIIEELSFTQPLALTALLSLWCFEQDW